jgi:hypothetical protein
VADHSHPGSVGNFTKNVFELTNGIARVNGGCENRRGSKHGCRSNAVPSAERDTAMRSLTVWQEYPVKLHNRIRIANRQAIAEQAPGDSWNLMRERPTETKGDTNEKGR